MPGVGPDLDALVRRALGEDVRPHLPAFAFLLVTLPALAQPQKSSQDQLPEMGTAAQAALSLEDESQIADIKLETRVNGEVRQSDRTSRMIFSFRKIINYISTFTTLVPGDVIVCGTPTGAGARFDPPIWLKPGDVVEVEAEGLGILSNTIEDEA